MEQEKDKIKKIRNLMLFAALLVLALLYSKQIFGGIKLALGIVMPFLIGGAIAFVLNIPMKLIEKTILKKCKPKLKRPLGMILTLLLVLCLLALLSVSVIPQLALTITEVVRQVPMFLDRLMVQLQSLDGGYPIIQNQTDILAEIEKNWDTIVGSIGGFLKSGVGNVVNSTIGFAGSVISGVTSVVISFIFSLYVLAGKERLGNQGKRILSAYLPKKAYDRVLYVCSLLYKNFSNFITGQCTEAVILGLMFIITMTICRMPYAVMIGILIGFTALLPIVGAFIGCAVGAFLLLLQNPMQAVWFLILFLVLQQIEGNLIYPKVVGSSVGLPAIWVLVAVSVGGSLFGVAGMLVFIPLLSTGYTLLRENVNRRNQNRMAKQGKNGEDIDGSSRSVIVAAEKTETERMDGAKDNVLQKKKVRLKSENE